MIANETFKNTDQVQVILLDTQTVPYTGIQRTVVSSVDVLSITNEDKLNLNQYIDITCISTSNELNAVIRLKYFLETEGRKVIINSFKST